MVKKRTLDLNKVLDQATQMIDEDGLAAVTMPKLAKALGIRSQSLYHYVSNRHELLSLVAARRLEFLRQKLMQEVIGLSGKEAVYRFADIIRDFLLSDRAIASTFFTLNEYTIDAAIAQKVMEILDLGKKIDVNKDHVISIHALLGAVLGYVFFDRSKMFKDEDAQQASENYHEMLLRLVSPKTSES